MELRVQARDALAFRVAAFQDDDEVADKQHEVQRRQHRAERREQRAHGLFVIACVRVKRHGAHAERRKAVVGERIQDEHRADEQIPLVAPFVAVHEVSDDEQHDAVIREVQRAHAGEARGNLDGEAQPVHRARQRILPIEVPGRPKQNERHERQREPAYRRQRHGRQVLEERPRAHGRDDFLLRHAHEAREEEHDERVVDEERAMGKRARGARRLIPRHSHRPPRCFPA